MKKLLLGAALTIFGMGSVSAKEYPLVPAKECEEVVWDRLCVGMTKEDVKKAYWRSDKDKTAYSSVFWDWELEYANDGYTLSKASRKFKYNVTQPMLVESLKEKYGEPDKVETVQLEDTDTWFMGKRLFHGRGVYTATKWTWEVGRVTIVTVGEEDESMPVVTYYVNQPNADLNL